MDKIAASPAEGQFLLSILGPSANDAGRERRIASSAAIQHPVSAAQLAARHGLLPLLYSRFEDWPALSGNGLGAAVARECLLNTARNLALAAELLALLEQFGAAGIPALPFKGVALAAAVYGNVGLRPAGDLDILIHQRDLDRASAILTARGYSLATEMRPDGTPVEEDLCEHQFLQKGPAAIVVELRWRLSPSRFRRDLGMDVLWPARRSATLLGKTVPQIGPEETLVLLCMHGTKHEWLRLFWVADIVQLLDATPDLDWHRAHRIAKRFGLWRALGLGVLLSHRMAGAAVPGPVLRRFERDRTIGQLEQHIRKHFFESDTPPFNGLPLQIEALGFEDRLARVSRAVFEPPGALDRAAIQLPRGLHFLYHVIRPVRLFWKYIVLRTLHTLGGH